MILGQKHAQNESVGISGFCLIRAMLNKMRLALKRDHWESNPDTRIFNIVLCHAQLTDKIPRHVNKAPKNLYIPLIPAWAFMSSCLPVFYRVFVARLGQKHAQKSTLGIRRQIGLGRA